MGILRKPTAAQEADRRTARILRDREAETQTQPERFLAYGMDKEEEGAVRTGVEHRGAWGQSSRRMPTAGALPDGERTTEAKAVKS